MIALAGAVKQHPGALLALRRAPLRAVPIRRQPAMIAPSIRRRPAIIPSVSAIQTSVSVLKIAAGALAGATAVLAIINHHGSTDVTPALEPAGLRLSLVGHEVNCTPVRAPCHPPRRRPAGYHHE